MKNNGIADFMKPTIITAQQYGTKVSVEIDHSDTDIDELMDAFQTLIVGLGYHNTSFKNWVLDKADNYRETDTEELKEKLTEWQDDDVAAAVYHRNIKESQRAQLVKMMEDDEQLGLYDDAIAEHNTHEEGFSIDGGFDGKPIPSVTDTTYLSVPVNFYTDSVGDKVYDYEGMADQFGEQLSELDESVVVMFSVEIQPINKKLIEAAKKYKKKVKTQ